MVDFTSFMIPLLHDFALFNDSDFQWAFVAGPLYGFVQAYLQPFGERWTLAASVDIRLDGWLAAH